MRRIISCFTNSYGRFGPREAIARVRAAGIDHIELAIKTDGVPSLFGEEPMLTNRSGPREVDDVRCVLDAAGVSLSSCNITSGNPQDDDAMAVTLRKLQLAADLGVDHVVAGAGESDRPDQQAGLLQNLRRIGDAAGALGIIYCFETHPGLCRDAAGMVRTMEALDHPYLQLNFDPGNLLYYNEGADVVSGLTMVLPWVRHVHLKDHNGRAGDWHFPALGAGGAVDFAAVRAALDSIRFAGPYSVEIEGLPNELPRSREQTHRRVVESVAHLRRCGYFD